MNVKDYVIKSILDELFNNGANLDYYSVVRREIESRLVIEDGKIKLLNEFEQLQLDSHGNTLSPRKIVERFKNDNQWKFLF